MMGLVIEKNQNLKKSSGVAIVNPVWRKDAKLTPNYQLHLAANTIESTPTQGEYGHSVYHLFPDWVLIELNRSIEPIL